MSKSPPIVVVEWEDSAVLSRNPWSAGRDVQKLKPLVCYSAGYLIRKTKKRVVVCAHLAGHQVAGELSIPAGCIKNMKVIKP